MFPLNSGVAKERVLQQEDDIMFKSSSYVKCWYFRTPQCPYHIHARLEVEFSLPRIKIKGLHILDPTIIRILKDSFC